MDIFKRCAEFTATASAISFHSTKPVQFPVRKATPSERIAVLDSKKGKENETVTLPRYEVQFDTKLYLFIL